MQKLTKIIENHENPTEFKYDVLVRIQGVITAPNEGEAGYLIDSEIEALPGYYTHQIELIAPVSEFDNHMNSEDTASTFEKFIDVVTKHDKNIDPKNLSVSLDELNNWTVYHKNEKHIVLPKRMLTLETIKRYNLGHKLNESYMQAEEDPMIKKFLDVVRVADNTLTVDDVKVDASPKGNWNVYINGKRIMTVDGNLLNDEAIMKYQLEYHGE